MEPNKGLGLFKLAKKNSQSPEFPNYLMGSFQKIIKQPMVMRETNRKHNFLIESPSQCTIKYSRYENPYFKAKPGEWKREEQTISVKGRQFINEKKNTQSPELPNYLTGSFAKLKKPTIIHPEGKTYHPDIRNEISYESPTYFLGKQSQISKSSYDNPFIKVQEGNKNEIILPKSNTLRNMQTFYINADRDNKMEDLQSTDNFSHGKFNIVNYTQSKDHSYKLHGIQKYSLGQEHSKIMNTQGNFNRKKSTYYQQNKKDYFGDFTDKNDYMNVYGSLYARERPEKTRIVKDYSLTQEEYEKKLGNRRQASLAHQKTHTYTEGSTFNFSNSPSKNHNKIEQEAQYIKTEYLDGSNKSPCMNNTITLPSLEQKQSGFFQNKSKTSKSDLNFANFLSTRQSFIDKIIPVPVVQHEGVKYLDRDQCYLNEFNNQIVTGKINQQMRETALKMVEKYSTISKEKSSQQQFDTISEFEQLQQKLFRQKKALQKSAVNTNQIVKVEREYNQGKIWFQNASSLQEKSIKQ